ncbi:MAG: hypothetical protein U5K71_14355 [Gracilimonas sp.]|nr:hypothetical protein [Gracilimonas sp.]
MKDTQLLGLDNINDYYDVNLKYDRLADCGISQQSEGMASNDSE